jgi:hypothetical protein
MNVVVVIGRGVVDVVATAVVGDGDDADDDVHANEAMSARAQAAPAAAPRIDGPTGERDPRRWDVYGRSDTNRDILREPRR